MHPRHISKIILDINRKVSGLTFQSVYSDLSDSIQSYLEALHEFEQEKHTAKDIHYVARYSINLEIEKEQIQQLQQQLYN